MQGELDLTGKLLIALPGIGDPRFERTIIFMCAHTPDFAMGLVVNRPIDGLDLHTLMEQMGVPLEISLRGTPVLEGGPVATDRGFVLHTDDVICDGATLEIDGEICMTATRDILISLGSPTPPRRAVLALGYAGWSAGQIESEIAANAWLVGTPDTDLVFGSNHDSKWRHAMTRIGVDLGRLNPGAGNA